MRKLQENLWNTWIWWQVLRRPPITQILTFLKKSRKKSAVKLSIEKPISLSFVNLFITIFPRVSEKTDFYFQLGPDPSNFSEDFSISKDPFVLQKLIFRANLSKQRPKIDKFQKQLFSTLALSAKLRLKNSSDCSRAVFMKRFYFLLIWKLIILEVSMHFERSKNEKEHFQTNLEKTDVKFFTF